MADLRIVDAPVLLQESITDDVKMPTGGLGNFSVRLGDILWYVITKEQLANKNYVDLSSKSVKDSLDVHIADKANPHQVTKEQIGLGNVDNTADIDKPVSDATKSAIITATTDMATKAYVNQKDNLKADKATTLSGYGITDAYTKDETYNRDEIDGRDGDLSTLKTADKTNLVKAVNEIHDVTKGVVALYDRNVEASAAGAGANGWTDLLVSTANGRTQRDKNSEIVSILDFFTIDELTAFKSNPSMDVTTIIKRAFATGVKKINFLDLQMHITPDVSTGLGITFASGDIELYGNGATFIDDTVYPNNDKVAALFTLGGAVTSFKSNINYIGKPVDLTTKIGYVGATYVYSKGANKNITVNARLENIRYGILAGGYADPNLGGTKTVRGSLQCKNVGYPIATYLADDIEMTITGDGFHRVHYIAGCNHARMTTRTKNYYIAPISHLYSDAKTGDGTSKGCSDCHTDATDMGSTSYVANGYLMAISLSRADPNTIFDDVRLKGYVKGATGKAEKLGLATINSSIRAYQPSYPANWDSTIELNNISISGTIDRSLQTTEEHGFSDLYLACRDDVSIPGTNVFPMVKNLNIDVDYFAGNGSRPRGFWWFLDGLQDVANVRLNAKNSGVNVIRSNANSLIRFDKSAIIGVDTGNSASFNSKMEFINCDIYGGNAYLPPTNKRFSNTKIGVAYPDSGVLIKTLTNELTLTGSTVTWANALPQNSLIVGISFVLTEAITGTSGLMLGLPTAAAKFYNVLTTVQGAAVGISSTAVGSLPYTTQGTQSLVITARDGAAFTTGKIKIVVDYINIGLPTI